MKFEKVYAEYDDDGEDRHCGEARHVALSEGDGPLREKLYGVRLDTSGTLVDRSVADQMGDFDPRGVNPRLVYNVREALDAEGFTDVKIIVSGGFTVEKIRAFENQGVPVDIYGVGSSLFRDGGKYDFTADVVMMNGKACAKVGRWHRPNDRLELVQ